VFDEAERAVLARIATGLAGDLGAAIGEVLTRGEVRATQSRVAALIESGRFPEPDPSRPALPWPPF
jgi:hypothetical protein